MRMYVLVNRIGDVGSGVKGVESKTIGEVHLASLETANLGHA